MTSPLAQQLDSKNKTSKLIDKTKIIIKLLQLYYAQLLC